MRMLRALLMPMRMSFRVAIGAIVVAVGVVVVGVVVIRCELGRVADMLGRVLGRPLVLVMMALVCWAIGGIPPVTVGRLAFGMMMRATATSRANAMASGRSAVSFTGTPFTSFHRLIGTLSGWTGRLASSTSMPSRSSTSSPMPMMPPQQTLMPASRAWASVSMRSCKVRVVMMFS